MSRDKFIKTRPVADPDFAETLQKMREPIQARAGLDLTVSAGLDAWRLADLVYTMLRRRNPAYVDNRLASRNDMIGYAVSLGPLAFHTWLTVSEVVRRVRQGQSLFSLESNEKIEAKAFAAEGVVIGVNVAQIRNGRTLIHKRKYSANGRAFLAATAASNALRLGIQVRKMAK